MKKVMIILLALAFSCQSEPVESIEQTRMPIDYQVPCDQPNSLIFAVPDTIDESSTEIEKPKWIKPSDVQNGFWYCEIQHQQKVWFTAFGQDWGFIGDYQGE